MKTIRVKFFLLLLLIGLSPSFVEFIFEISQVQIKPFLLLGIQVCFVLVLGFIIAFYFSKRFQKLIFITQKINQKDFNEKIPIIAEDEIAHLGIELNKLFDAQKVIQENFELALQQRSQALIESEKKHRGLVNLLSDAVCETDQNYRFVRVKNIEKLLGYQNKEMLGKKITDFLVSEDSIKLNKLLKQSQGKGLKDVKLRIFNKKKKIQYVLLNCRTIHQNHKVLRREGTLRDITEREQLAERIVVEKNKLEQAYQNLHKSYLALGKINAQVGALSEINTTFASDLNWQDKLNYITESIRIFMQADASALFIYFTKEKEFIFNRGSENLHNWENAKILRKASFVKEMLQTRKPVKFFDINTTARKKILQKLHIKGMLIIPVIVNNEIIALYNLYFKNPKILQEIPTKLTLAYTSQMAITLMMTRELDQSFEKKFSLQKTSC